MRRLFLLFGLLTGCCRPHTVSKSSWSGFVAACEREHPDVDLRRIGAYAFTLREANEFASLVSQDGYVCRIHEVSGRLLQVWQGGRRTWLRR